MKDIVIIGAGNFGREVAQLIEEINEDKKPGTYWDTLMKPLKNKKQLLTIMLSWVTLAGLKKLH
ncbi:hypothetical protein JQ038_17475 [Clostridium botulinum]|nr:hypothetical protein [Clostridium botulinum]MCS4479574.1 hypothetical protein [Clostridium botulinum]MCS4483540.1 hypothetical protein [Clostridium botulinum]